MYPRVSVVLTSYNHADFIYDAIESVLNQTYNNFELIIWDDCSSDNSWDIIQSFNDERIKSFRNVERKRGVYGINKAILELSKSEFIAIHHSDDVWKPSKLSKQISFLKENAHIDAVFTHAKIIEERGAKDTPTANFYKLIFNEPNRTRYEWIRHLLLKGNCLCHPSLLVRRSAYLKVGGYRLGFAQLGDLDMWLRLLSKCAIYVLQEQLVGFRLHGADRNSSADTEVTRIRSAFEFSRLLDSLKDMPLNDLLKVFPESRSDESRGVTNARRLLAESLLTHPVHPGLQLAALNLFFNEINSTPLTSSSYNEVPRFTELTALHDPFNIRLVNEISRLNSEASRLSILRNDLIVSIVRAVIRKRARSSADDKIFVWGAGTFGLSFFHIMRFHDIHVEAIVSEQPSDCFKDITIPVVSAEVALNVMCKFGAIVFIASTFMEDINLRISELGLRSRHLFVFLNPGDLTGLEKIGF